MINEHDIKDYEQLPFDPVEKPKHYMLFPDKGIEVRDVLECLANKLTHTHLQMKVTPMFAADYVQAMQYGMRFMEKNGIEDLKKMRWYLDKMIGAYEQSSKGVEHTRRREPSSVCGKSEQSCKSGQCPVCA